MQALQRLALAITLVTIALLAPVAHADTVAAYSFQDQFGGGKFTCKYIAQDPCSKLWTAQCWIEQGGWTYYGTGCVQSDGTISCTFVQKIEACGCGGWQVHPTTIFVCRPGYSGCWTRVGNPQGIICCSLR